METIAGANTTVLPKKKPGFSPIKHIHICGCHLPEIIQAKTLEYPSRGPLILAGGLPFIHGVTKSQTGLSN